MNNKKMEASELRYRRLFETAQDGVLLIDFETGMILDVNPFLIKMLGYSKKSFLKKYLWEVGVFKNIAASKSNFKTLQDKKYVRFEDLPLETKTGKKIDVEFVANAYTVGKETIIQCNIRDITDRRIAEILLEKSENRFRSIFENNQLGIALSDKEFEFIKINSTFCEMLGYTEKELLKKNFKDITHPDDLNQSIENVKKISKGNISDYRIEKRYIKKSGETIWVNVTISIIRDKNKSFLYYLAMIEDITERKITEEQLYQSENKYRNLFENMTSGVAVYKAIDNGKDFIFNDFNHTAEKIEGINRSKVLGKRVTKVFPGIKYFGIFEVFQKVWRSGKSEYFPENIYKDKKHSGSWRENWIYKLPTGEIVAVYNDVTERKKIEENLRQSEEKFSKAFRVTSHALCITNAKSGRFVDVNDAFVSMTGYSRKEILVSSSLGLNLWVDTKNREDVLSDLFAGKPVINREYYFKKKDGQVLITLFSVQTIKLNNELCLMSSIIDITDRKRLEQLAIDIKNRDEAIFTSIGDAVFATDKQGKILLFNKMAEKMIGVSMEKVIGFSYKGIINFIKESDGKPANDFIREAIEENKLTKMTNHTMLISQDGNHIPVADSAAPIKNSNGEIIGCVVVFRDVTQERQIDKAKTEFVSLASHQLRTPLSAINWYSEMLLSEDIGKLTLKQKEYFQEVYHASQRMVALVNALLNVSRLEMGTLAIEPVLTDITKIAKTCLSDLKQQILIKKIIIKQKYDKNISLMKVDPKLLTIILQNFLSNSIKYSYVKGKVELEIKKEKNNLVIMVSDNGIGIPKYQQKEIFGKLFRADNAKKTDPDGTGLGLYIIKRIIDNVNGKVWFESNKGKGVTFYASLPMSGMVKKSGSKKLI